MLKAYRFFSLPFPEKRFFIRAFLFLAGSRVALHFLPFERLITECDAKCRRVTVDSCDKNLPLARAVYLILTASRYVPFSTCLSKSLAGRVLLAERGYQTTLKIGVKKDIVKGFEAHAWLENEGKPVLCNMHMLEHFQEIPLENLDTSK